MRALVIALLLGSAVAVAPGAWVIRVVGASGSPGTAELIAWYDMEEGIGTRDNAQGTTSRDLAVATGTPASRTGVNGDAIDLIDADSDRVEATDSAFNFGDSDFTFVAWAKLDAVTNAQFIGGVWGGAGNRSYAFYKVAGSGASWRFYVSADGTTNSYVESTTGTVDTGWHFVAAYHDAAANTIGISVDGSSWVTSAYSSGTMTGLTTFFIGDDPATARNNGAVDSVALFSRVLTESEIEWLHNSGSGRQFSDL